MTNPMIETFFCAHGAHLADHQIRFGETAGDVDRLAQQTTVSVMMYHGLLEIEAADNLKFLQGQFTCDVREVTREQWRYGALCTPQGRMLANFLLLQRDTNRHALRLPTGVIDALQNTLKKFAPFYKASFANRSDQMVLLGIAGPGATRIIAQCFGSAPAAGHALQHEHITVIALDATRFECWIPNDQLARVWPLLTAHATPTGCAYWQLLNIRAGLGEVRAPTVEHWTPHMLNLQATGAINFKKGCYTGQEIVARTEYRGHQKRAMYRLCGSGPLPDAATPIHAGEHVAGEIVMASEIANQQWEALAVLSENYLAQTLSCQNHAITLRNLPYEIPHAHQS